MKKFRSAISALLAILLLSVTALTLSSCGLSGTKKDAFGIRRSKDAWLSECLLLSEEPDSFYDLFGEEGESGLLTKEAVKNSGKVNASGSNYFVCLWYGKASTAAPETYLKFTLVNETGVYYDDACVKITNETYVDGTKCFNGFSVPEDQRIHVSAESDIIQGGFILEFSFVDGMEGELYVDCYVKSKDEVTERYESEGLALKVSKSEIAVNADLSNITVGYLTKDAYNEGDFTDDLMSAEPPFDVSSVVYMVVSFDVTPTKSNEGGHTMGVMLHVSDRFTVFSNIEDVPTNKISQTPKGKEMYQYAVYSVPAVKGETKDVRMIFELVGTGNGGVSMGLYFLGAPTVALGNNAPIKVLENRYVSGCSLELTLSMDRTHYIVAGVVSDSITTIEIPDAMDDGIPVTTIKAGAFSNLTQITEVIIGDNVTEISAGAFSGCIALKQVHIGKGVTSIGADAFAYTNITEITYSGTREEWEQITKEQGWNGNVSLPTVRYSTSG